MNSLKQIDIKNRMYHFFDGMINIKIDLNKIKIDGKSYKNILIYHNRYVKDKDLSYIKINSVNPYISIGPPSVGGSYKMIVVWLSVCLSVQHFSQEWVISVL